MATLVRGASASIEDAHSRTYWGHLQTDFPLVMSSTYFWERSTCRVCSSANLEDLMDFGRQALASRFPRASEPDPPLAPLALTHCNTCGLVQLRHSVNAQELYTDHYGYKSGTNATMRGHLAELVDWAQRRRPVRAGDIVLDIGCNDGTLLKSYATPSLRRFGIDAIADKFQADYPDDISIRQSFFSADAYRALCGVQPAKIITSIAMFYDLEEPSGFAAAVQSALAPDGIWVLEQSYLPTMLEMNAYDTVCHEHLEYYTLRQIEWIAAANGLRVLDVELNSCNGGSFRLALCHKDAPFADNNEQLDSLRKCEANLVFDARQQFEEFQQRVTKSKDDLQALVMRERAAGKRFYLYGASTKGNTLLQYCNLDAGHIVAAAERNPEKWGCRTPRTNIPIVSEEEARAARPDYFLVLPWHFRSEFVRREAAFLEGGGKLVFPLPKLEIV